MNKKLKFIVWEDKLEYILEQFGDKIKVNPLDDEIKEGLPIFEVEIDAEIATTQFYFSRLLTAGYMAGISDLAKSSQMILSKAKENLLTEVNIETND